MRIVFSRKGFDSSYGGAPSPIIDGRPLSLPIPGSRGEQTTYGALGLGELVSRATRGRMSAADACHDDPMFAGGYCWLGQVNQAQGHLRNQGVGIGDVFLFYGLFADEHTGERHHRIFGAMTVACHGAPAQVRAHARWREPPRLHPHFSGAWESSNTVYHGTGTTARRAAPALRPTRAGGPCSHWQVPGWLRSTGLSFHASARRWTGDGELQTTSPGQEFVCDIGEAKAPRAWLEGILAEIAG